MTNVVSIQQWLMSNRQTVALRLPSALAQSRASSFALLSLLRALGACVLDGVLVLCWLKHTALSIRFVVA